MENDNLQHYGVKGMKWGVTRGARKASKAAKKDRKKASKYRRTLSDADIKKRIERLESEKKLKSLTENDIAPGRKAVKEVLSNAGKKAAGTIAAGTATYAVKVALEKKFDPKEAAKYLAPRPKKK